MKWSMMVALGAKEHSQVYILPLGHWNQSEELEDWLHALVYSRMGVVTSHSMIVGWHIFSKFSSLTPSLCLAFLIKT